MPGGRGEDVDDEEILRVLDQLADPYATSSDVAGQLPIGREQTRVRLVALREEGRVVGHKLAGAWLWKPAE